MYQRGTFIVLEISFHNHNLNFVHQNLVQFKAYFSPIKHLELI